MTSGRPKRPAALAVTRSGTFVWWYQGAMEGGIDTREAASVLRFLQTNHAALEKIDVHQLAAGQLLSNGGIDRNLQARLNRVDKLCTDIDPTTPSGAVMRYRVRTKASSAVRVQKRRDNNCEG